MDFVSTIPDGPLISNLEVVLLNVRFWILDPGYILDLSMGLDLGRCEFKET